MAPKTVESDGAAAFLAGVEPAERRTEAERLDAIFREVTGWRPRLWGPSILGYGRYAGSTGAWPATGFSPRKADLVLYIMPGTEGFADILAGLGPHRMGKSCVYLKRLRGVDEVALRRLIRAGLDEMGRRHVLEAT